MLHPLEQVRDHQNPLADPPPPAGAASSCSIPSSRFAIIRTRWQTRPLSRRAKRRSSAAPNSLRKKYAGIVHPQTWYAYLITLPHLGITGSRYKRTYLTATTMINAQKIIERTR